MSELTIKDLHYHTIGPVSLTIQPGYCACLTGPSGAGKTLLLRAIADLDPHKGEISLGGTRADSIPAPEWRKLVGMLPTESQWWHDTVGAHIPKPDLDLLHTLGFDESALQWSVRRMSIGEKRRLGLVRLLSNKPRALLLDEPTANLDPKNVRIVEEIIDTYKDRHNAPVLWVSHDPDQTIRIADKRLILSDGSLQEVKE